MNLQTLKEQKGFTIVELLIVIVVIGILAAITIVAFNGVQNRAKSTKSQAVASDVQKKAEAYNAEKEHYPLAAADFTGISALSAGNHVLTTGTDIPEADRQTTALYTPCGSGTPVTASNITGATVQFWDFSAGALTPTTGTTKTITVGSC